MKKYNKEIKIGIAFIIGCFLLYIGVNFLKGSNIFSHESDYYLVYNRINSLSPSAIVTTNGYKVGTVKHVEYDYTKPDRFVVTLSVDKRLRIPLGSKAYLKSELLGGVSIDLQIVDGKYYHIEGDTIATGYSSGLMGEIEDVMLPQIKTIIPKIDSLIVSLNHIASNPALSESLNNVSNLTAKLNITTDGINQILHQEFPLLMQSLHNTGENLNNITDGLNSINYHQTMNHLDSTITNLLILSEVLKSNDSSIGRLINDTVFYNRINEICTNANAVIEDVKANPSRYINISIFGKK